MKHALFFMFKPVQYLLVGKTGQNSSNIDYSTAYAECIYMLMARCRDLFVFDVCKVGGGTNHRSQMIVSVCSQTRSVRELPLFIVFSFSPEWFNGYL